jgi:hypothetical protein
MDNSNPAPRLPDISIQTFKNNIIEILEVLYTLRNICLRINPILKKTSPTYAVYSQQEQCGDKLSNCGRFNLLVYDNNETEPRLIYNNKKDERFDSPEIFVRLIEELVNIPKGGRVKKHKIRKSKITKKNKMRNTKKNKRKTTKNKKKL